MEQDSSLRLAALPSPCRLSTVANNMQSFAFMSWRRLFHRPLSCRTGCTKRSCIVCYYCQLFSTPSQQMTKKRDSTQQVSQGWVFDLRNTLESSFTGDVYNADCLFWIKLSINLWLFLPSLTKGEYTSYTISHSICTRYQKVANDDDYNDEDNDDDSRLHNRTGQAKGFAHPFVFFSFSGCY